MPRSSPRRVRQAPVCPRQHAPPRRLPRPGIPGASPSPGPVSSPNAAPWRCQRRGTGARCRWCRSARWPGPSP